MSSRHRMYPDADQAMTMLMHCDHARFLYNLASEQHQFARKYGRRCDARQSWPNQKEQSKQLTEARETFEWLKAGTTTVQQGALRDFDRALKNHFSNPGHFGFPKYRSKNQTQGFIVRDVTIKKLNRKWCSVQIPKVGYVKFRTSRPVPDGIGHGRVTLNRAGQWHVSFSAPQPQVPRANTSRCVGVDRGIARTVTHSDGTWFDAPEPKSVKRLQRRLARQQKGSNRRNRTRHRIAKVHQHNADARKDWVEKYTTQLVRANDLIVVEDLKTKNMVRVGGGLARGILESCWSDIVTRTEQKAATCDVVVVKINPAYTSQKCNSCGHTTKENRESQAVFQCVSCGHTANADVNAACNILAAGLAVLGPSERGRGDLVLAGSVKRQPLDGTRREL